MKLVLRHWQTYALCIFIKRFKSNGCHLLASRVIIYTITEGAITQHGVTVALWRQQTAWVAMKVFNFNLDAIRKTLLGVNHDTCTRGWAHLCQLSDSFRNPQRGLRCDLRHVEEIITVSTVLWGWQTMQKTSPILSSSLFCFPFWPHIPHPLFQARHHVTWWRHEWHICGMKGHRWKCASISHNHNENINAKQNIGSYYWEENKVMCIKGIKRRAPPPWHPNPQCSLPTCQIWCSWHMQSVD